jgi:outer membrane protein
MTRSIFAFCIAYTLVGGFAAGRAQAADDKIGYVDLQRALEETNDGKAAKSKLKSDFDKKQKELDEKQEELKKMKDDLDKKSTLLKPDVLASEQKKFQDRFVELQSIYSRLQKDLAQKEQEATAGIFRKLQTVVGTIAEREKFAMVLEKNSAVVWGQPSLDITNEVIRMYNAGSGGGATGAKK